jgi:hypothetical protein
VSRIGSIVVIGVLAGLVISLYRFPIPDSFAASHPNWDFGQQEPPSNGLPPGRKMLPDGTTLSSLNLEPSSERDPQSIGTTEGRIAMQLLDSRNPTAQSTEESNSIPRAKLQFFAIIVGGAVILAILLFVVIYLSRKEPYL